MPRKLHTRVLGTAFLLGCAFFASPAAAEFVVSPVRLDLGPTSRSGAIKVRNDGKEKLGFQLEAMEWRQDAAGKDQYAATQELVFFPKIMSVEPGEEGVIRVGARTPLVETEKTYRLFIQELPGSARKTEGTAPQVNFLIRFGAPVFVGPAKPQDSLTLDSVAMVKGAVSLSARNGGNRHQIVQGIYLKGADTAGKELYALTLTDRYLLAGTSKAFSAEVPAAQCALLASLSVEIKTDKLSTVRKLDVTPSMCP
jgi:fimbrial chaperone protein